MPVIRYWLSSWVPSKLFGSLLYVYRAGSRQIIGQDNSTQMRKVALADTPVGVLGAALLFVVLFWRLGAPTFWDPDEAHYAQTSREMLRTGDWLAPSYNDQPFFDKPILFHWFQAGAMSVAGVNELGAR